MTFNQAKKDIAVKFYDTSVQPIKIDDYLDWLAHPEKYERKLALPPIQRGFVWKPWQIQDLWDSLMREMPVGAFLVQEFERGDPVRQEDNATEESEDPGWYLLDGQQRTLSLRLGYPHHIKGMKHKLWIDFSEDGYKHGAKFQFRVTTENQPFGYPPNGRGRLQLSTRREAYRIWREENKPSQDELRVKEDIFHHPSTMPWKSDAQKRKHTFLVSELWEWMDECVDRLSSWKEKVICEITKRKVSLFDREEQRIDDFGKALISLKKQSIALIKVENTDTEKKERNDDTQDYLTLLFERISKGGTQLSSEDLLFAMIKRQWYQAHDLVNDLHKKVGVMMSPTDFVMTAFRLAALRANDVPDDAKPGPAYFHSHLSTLLNDGEKPLRSMIENGEFVNVFGQLKKAISYPCHHMGLPEALMPYLDRYLLQVILHWSLDASEEEIHSSREDIIRFILFWLVAHKDASSAQKASVKAIKELKIVTGQKLFPAREIYTILTQAKDDRKSIFSPLVPILNKSPPQVETSPFRSPIARAKHYFGENEGEELYKRFISRKHLLLWFQREWIHKTFFGTNFLSGQDEDTVPYDFDHLVPQSNWSSFRGRGKQSLKTDKEKVFEDLWPRRGLGNSIGNYRVMTASDNRIRKDESLSAEDGLLHKLSEWPKYAFGPLSNGSENKWRIASDTDVWSDERVRAFQYAVEARTLYLYKRLYKEAGFKAWVPES